MHFNIINKYLWAIYQQNAAAEDIMYHNLKQMRLYFMIIYLLAVTIIYGRQNANFNITLF